MLSVRVTLPSGVSLSIDGDTLSRTDVDHLVLDLAPQLAARLNGGADVAAETPPPARVRRTPPLPTPETPTATLAATAASEPAHAPVMSPTPVEVSLEVLAYCREHDPGATMRRIVAIAAGVSRQGGAGITVPYLTATFTTLGWQSPSDFSAAVRNAARASFGWLARVPEREGVYAITPKGRQEVLGETQPPAS